MLWIEAQSAPVITLLVFGVCYMLAAAIFCLAAILSRRAVAQDLKAVVPVTLTPLGVVLGLVMVFLASRVWTNVDRAGEYVGQEAGALRETVLLADSLPPEVRTNVRQAIQRHLHFVESEEWPAMARRQASLRSIAVGLVEALSAVLSFAPVQINQQLAQQRAVVAIEHALDARRNRIRLKPGGDCADPVDRNHRPRCVDPDNAGNGTYRKSIGDGHPHVHFFDGDRSLSSSPN